ncbi:unnamed protein product [Prunus armeniaca]
MQQPSGFTNSKQPRHVCRLLKSLYGLKQGPRAWNERFTTHLLTLGKLLQLLVVQYTYSGIHVNKSKYATDLLAKAGMTHCKPCPTPCLPTTKLLKFDGVPLSDPTLYRSLAYSDADWADDVNDRRSTTGYVIFLGNNPIFWCAKKQSTVSRSSTKAEYRALAITLSRTKHIEIDFHFIRERVTRGDVVVSHIPSSNQVVDIFTKGLHTSQFSYLRDNLMLSSPSISLRGDVSLHLRPPD